MDNSPIHRPLMPSEAPRTAAEVRGGDMSCEAASLPTRKEVSTIARRGAQRCLFTLKPNTSPRAQGSPSLQKPPGKWKQPAVGRTIVSHHKARLPFQHNACDIRKQFLLYYFLPAHPIHLKEWSDAQKGQGKWWPSGRPHPSPSCHLYLPLEKGIKGVLGGLNLPGAGGRDGDIHGIE